MSLATWWRPAARHRAVDRVVQLTAERDYLLATLTKQDGQIAAANGQTERLLTRIDALVVERDALLGAYDELFARHQECTAISIPAPAGLDNTVPMPMPVVVPLQFAFAPNRKAAA